MQNRKFKHRTFLNENNIRVETLPHLLRKRIRGFDELVEDYQHTLQEDQETMKDYIKQLDLEIEEDLYALFEFDLENNEEVEGLEKEVEKPLDSKKEKEEQEVGFEEKHKEESKEESKAKQKVLPLAAKSLKQAPETLDDEAILEELWKMNRKTNLKRSSLKGIGIKNALRGWKFTIGKYQLKRSRLFSYTYELTKLSGK